MKGDAARVMVRYLWSVTFAKRFTLTYMYARAYRCARAPAPGRWLRSRWTSRCTWRAPTRAGARASTTCREHALVQTTVTVMRAMAAWQLGTGRVRDFVPVRVPVCVSLLTVAFCRRIAAERGRRPRFGADICG